MNLRRLLCAILALTLVFTLCACANTGDVASPEDTPAVDMPTDSTTDTDGTADTTDIAPTDTSEFAILTDPAIPSREDIMRIFEHASSIWDKIHISSLDAVWDTPTEKFSVIYQGTQYSPVRDYQTKADLEARFRECFSTGLTEHQLGHMFEFQYCEIDGRLYVTPGDRGTDIRAGSSTVEYEIIDDTTVSVARYINVREYTLGEEYDNMWYLHAICVQEMMLIYEDGRWVFDNFYVSDDLSNYVLVYDWAEKLTKAFIKAEALAAHFTGHASAYLGDDSFEVTDENGQTQWYSHYGLADSLAELRLMLEEVFTPELVERFMSTTVSGIPLFTERDGKLYKFGGYVGLLAYDDVFREITGYTEGVGTIDINVLLRGTLYENEIYANQTYTAVRGEDGKYRFGGDFTLPIEIASNMATGTPNVTDTPDTDEPDATDTQEPIESAFELLTDPAIPTEEDIMRALEHAQEIWGGFGTLREIYGEENAIQYNGYTYYPVKDYETKADFEARFRESFSKAATERKLESMFELLYREFDGRLCVIPADRGSDLRASMKGTEYEVINNTTIKVTRLLWVHDSANLNGGTAVWYLAAINPQEMLLIYEDGRWVFDNFFDWDDLSAYDNGEAIYYDFALDFTTAFLKAELLAAHFTGYASDYLDGDSFDVTDENGVTQKYTRYGLADSLAELRALLYEVFTPELAEDFMSTTVSGLPLFAEHDSRLYKLDGSVGLHVYDDVFRHIEGYADNCDGTVGLHIYINGPLWDESISENKVYTAVLGDDGKYRFSGDFELPIQIAERAAANP